MVGRATQIHISDEVLLVHNRSEVSQLLSRLLKLPLQVLKLSDEVSPPLVNFEGHPPT
jgi:hypothetical protein